VSKFKVNPESWLTNKTLKQTKLYYEGILVVGIARQKGKEQLFVGAPKGGTRLETGDTIICYGREEALTSLAERMKGERGERQRKKAIKREYKLKGKLEDKKPT